MIKSDIQTDRCRQTDSESERDRERYRVNSRQKDRQIDRGSK